MKNRFFKRIAILVLSLFAVTTLHSQILDGTVQSVRFRVSLPATFYGDIGMAVMETNSKGACIKFSSKGYWWPQPSDNPPKEWQRRVDDMQHEEVNLLF